MPSYVPALPGLPRYTWWGDVPEGLSTKTDLDRQGFRPGSDPVGQVLYHGNSYAPLYANDEAVPKRACSPAQKAALDRARELQYECRRCGVRRDYRLGRGRWCEPCSYAAELYAAHQAVGQYARGLVGDRAATLVVVAGGPGEDVQPQTVAVLRVHDQELLHAGPAGPYGTSERAAVLELLDVLLEDRRIVHETDRGPVGRYPQILTTEPGKVMYSGQQAHGWMRAHTESHELGDYVSRLWRQWYGWTRDEWTSTASEPVDREYRTRVAWDRTADAADDARALAALLHRIADGTEPIWSGARWTADGHGTPDLSWDRTRTTTKEAVSA
ncbi:hypothetical protein [Streptomyces sp. NPDC053720]|uniref:hypothetical protein n=1 Tax=Streptomyces sp. NPDC053720 TaxID=3154855 RepID=UPI0034464648